MSESFAELFEESLKTLNLQPGAIITGIVVDIDGDWVTVHAGLKSEGVIPLEQFYNCLLYTSPSPRDLSTSRMPSSA